jgi:hypothetical protein
MFFYLSELEVFWVNSYVLAKTYYFRLPGRAVGHCRGRPPSAQALLDARPVCLPDVPGPIRCPQG